ncbi:hypothetical protein TSOC_003129 [Tetrabaena socialis]|uniref:UspA domain-containing protein n=1 Tax=Tetrabaena socialis TaxID=47790 RepID=A0A2J8ACD4_9CHLO|nr:hypothetical protein TSOC_003129 [Tetrabaena socialis]|eukprot:PNH10178.1 hypothetical protein TSOC_003129 [Tetrabaena socialis]
MASLNGEVGKLSVRKRGVKLCVLVSDSPSCKYAVKFMRAFLNTSIDEVHMVTACNTEDGRSNALSRQRELADHNPNVCEHVRFHVSVKEDDYTLHESLGRYVATHVRPQLIFMGSTCLPPALAVTRPAHCAPAGTNFPAAAPAAARAAAQRPGTAQGSPGGPASNRPAAPGAAGGQGAALATPLGLLGSSAALRILAELRCAPVMLVKHNSKGAWLLAPVTVSGGAGAVAAVAAFSGALSPAPAATGVAAFLRSNSLAHAPLTMTPSMKVMVDLHANSRHVLDWLFEHFTAGRDQLMLTVCQAYDERSNVKPAAQRLLTAFGVQAAVNSFEADKSMLAGPANKSLPQAVAEAEPDVLVVQLPRCKGLPQSITELLYSAKTSFLLWPPDYDAKHK